MGSGIVQVSPLVSFKVLFQCKRYSGPVTPSQVRDFRGAMQGRADKGIIVTTGGFTLDAKKEAVRDGVPPIELVDGEKLVTMIEELELGLLPIKSFKVHEPFLDEFKTLSASRTFGVTARCVWTQTYWVVSRRKPIHMDRSLRSRPVMAALASRKRIVPLL